MQTQMKTHNLRGSAICPSPREGNRFYKAERSLIERFTTEPLLLALHLHYCTKFLRELMPLYRQQSECELINYSVYKFKQNSIDQLQTLNLFKLQTLTHDYLQLLTVLFKDLRQHSSICICTGS